jgi:hypothetical protein
MHGHTQMHARVWHLVPLPSQSGKALVVLNCYMGLSQQMMPVTAHRNGQGMCDSSHGAWRHHEEQDDVEKVT